MSVWKDFCRCVESKIVREHFGDLVPILDECALFEFSDKQIEAARQHEPQDLASEEEYPIPPFPFPRIAMTGSGEVLVLGTPLLDETSGFLEFSIMMYRPDVDFFDAAECAVDPNSRDSEGKMVLGLGNVRGVWKGRYWDDDNPYSPIDPQHEDMTPERMEADMRASKKRTEEQLAEAHRRGDPRLIREAEKVAADLEAHYERDLEMIEQMRQLWDDNQLVEEKAIEMQKRETREAFYYGLQQVNWINFPNHYIIEIAANRPTKKKKKKKGRAQRLNERDRHIVLDKDEVKHRWTEAQPESERSSPIPHLRRGHYKTLRSEKYKEMRGKRIWVRATHVAGKCVEWREKGVSYKVL